MTDAIRGFLAELKRRKVYRVAIAYAIVGYVVIEVADLIFPALRLPAWTYSFVVVLVFLGFPIALVLAWALELSPEGLRRTRPLERDPRTPPTRAPRHSHARLLAVFAAGVLVSAIGYGAYSTFTTSPDAAGIESIAVLPLENYSDDPEQGYFVDGMTEALISQLGQLNALTVISRTSAMRYRDSEKALPEIARELNVDAIVEGSVYRSGDQVRITAQLVQADPERHLWANDYARELNDVLALQAEVARAIADEIAVTLTPQEQQRLEDARTVDPRVYEAYLRGRHLWTQRDPDALFRALEHFRGALEIDPTYAPLHAAIADVYLVAAYPAPPPEALPRAKAAALRALELDSTLAEAHTALAYATMTYDWDWETAGREFRRALELNPSYATGHQWYAEWLAAQGRLDEAVAQERRAEQLDPLSPVISRGVARHLFFARRYEEAAEQARSALELLPTNVVARVYLSGSLAKMGRYDEAFEQRLELARARAATVTEQQMSRFENILGQQVLQQLKALGDPEPRVRRLRRAYAESGWSGVLEQAARDMEYCARIEDPAFPPCIVYPLALTQAGRTEQALDHLERLIRDRGLSFFVVDLAADPRLDPLRDTPRYAELMRRVGLGSRVGSVTP